MSGINGAFRFHPVGQGLFYSGALCKKEGKATKHFHFVYDCGTTGKKESFLYPEIREYAALLSAGKAKTQKKKLDLLVVSHFHDDHVNGIPELMEYFDVDTVVMPYMTEFLRDVAVMEHELMKEASGDSADELTALYSDPVAWFAARGVRRILIVGEYEEWEPPLSIREDFNYALISLGENLSIAYESVIQRNFTDEGTETLHLKGGVSLISSENFNWEFFFENIRPESDALYTECQELTENFRRENEAPSLHELAQKGKLTGLGKEIKGNLSKILDGCTLNRTSVVMLHRPKYSLSSSDDIPLIAFIGRDFHSRWRSSDKRLFATLLTGDVIIKKDEPAQLEAILKEARQCLILQYPHHGSEKSGSHRNDMNRFYKLHVSRIVISYGLQNRFGHPDYSVLSSDFPDIIFVTEREAFNYQIFVKN